MALEIIPVKIEEDIEPNADIIDLVLKSAIIKDYDILIFTQKIISKSEGRIVALVKDENLDKVPALLPKDKEYFSAKIDTKGVVWSTIEE